jgi:hypothetical protein
VQVPGWLWDSFWVAFVMLTLGLGAARFGQMLIEALPSDLKTAWLKWIWLIGVCPVLMGTFLLATESGGRLWHAIVAGKVTILLGVAVVAVIAGVLISEWRSRSGLPSRVLSTASNRSPTHGSTSRQIEPASPMTSRVMDVAPPTRNRERHVDVGGYDLNTM